MSEAVPPQETSTPADSQPRKCTCRRSLLTAGLGLFGAGYAGAVAYPIYRYMYTPVAQAAAAAAVTEVALPEGAKLAPGSAMMFRFGTRPAVLIHHADRTWTSFSAVCTHLGCTVKFEPENRRIYCACHGGVYDPKTGEPLDGPPPKALTPYRVEVRDDQVVVARV